MILIGPLLNICSLKACTDDNILSVLCNSACKREKMASSKLMWCALFALEWQWLFFLCFKKKGSKDFWACLKKKQKKEKIRDVNKKKKEVNSKRNSKSIEEEKTCIFGRDKIMLLFLSVSMSPFCTGHTFFLIYSCRGDNWDTFFG